MRLLALVGAVGAGWLLFEKRPQELVIVYDVSSSPDATALEVELRAAGELVRHARIALGTGAQVRHPVRLREGSYVLAWRLERPTGPLAGERTLEIAGEQTIVLPLGR